MISWRSIIRGRCPQNKRYLRNKLHQEFLAY
ncbi:hypothetical protein predicted by Glimmer/Critica [Salmonella enterica subsp. enterica serovar Weltevreden str. 2007-60-3289-1]|nr:hypothetical protein predicted by Glimmer/Critica [Salmonella enterica subsp. enterica serovar Weltevreden str. 2007-60-3289-1]